mgnify:CR=1 FL=1
MYDERGRLTDIDSFAADIRAAVAGRMRTEPPPVPPTPTSVAARFWPHPSRIHDEPLSAQREAHIALFGHDVSRRVSLRFYTWPGVALLFFAPGLALLLAGSGVSWPMFVCGSLTFGIDLALRLRRGGGKALVHPNVGAQVLFVPLMVPGLLFALVGAGRLTSAQYAALDTDLVALRAERASGEAEAARWLLGRLERDLVASTAPETWHARIRQEDGQTLILVLAPTAGDFTDQVRLRLLDTIAAGAGGATGRPIFVGVIDQTDRWHGTISPQFGQRTDQARTGDVLPFYRRHEGMVARRRAAMVVLVSCLVAAAMWVSYRPEKPAAVVDRSGR